MQKYQKKCGNSPKLSKIAKTVNNSQKRGPKNSHLDIKYPNLVTENVNKHLTYLVGNSFARLVFIHNLWFFAYFGSQVLLGPTFTLARGPCPAYIKWQLFVYILEKSVYIVYIFEENMHYLFTFLQSEGFFSDISAVCLHFL